MTEVKAARSRRSKQQSESGVDQLPGVWGPNNIDYHSCHEIPINGSEENTSDCMWHVESACFRL